jgi:hypothetical protein
MSLWTNGLWGSLTPTAGYPQVANFAALPDVVIYNGKIYLVLTATGVWPFNRKPAGLYRSDGTSWSYMSAYPDMMTDSNFGIQNTASPTKVIAFSAAGITAGNTRVITAPDRNVAIDDLSVNTDTAFTGLIAGSGLKIRAALSGTDIKTINSTTILGTGDFSLIPKTQNTVTKEPTGFNDPASVIITYNSTDQTVTLTGTFVAYWQGEIIPALTTGWQSAGHPVTTNHIYFLYYNGTSFVWADNAFPGWSMLLIASVNYGATDKYCLRECHGFMPWQDHKAIHETIGCYKSSGGTIPTASWVALSTTATDRRPTIDETVINDEDIATTLPALTSKLYTQYFLSGASVGAYAVEAAELLPVLVNNPYYNSFSTPNWGQTLFPSNSVGTVWIFAVPVTSSAGSQKYRYLFIQPQWVTLATSGSAGNMTTARNTEIQRSQTELNLGTLTVEAPEIVCIAKVIVQFVTNWSIGNIILMSGNRYSLIGSPSGNFLSIVSTNGGLSGDGTAGNPLITTLSTGLAGGQTIIGGTGTTDKLTFKTTTGVGAAGANFIFQVGNNGATEAMRIFNTAQVGIGRATEPASGTILDVSSTAIATDLTISNLNITAAVKSSRLVFNGKTTGSVEAPKAIISTYSTDSTTGDWATISMGVTIGGAERLVIKSTGNIGAGGTVLATAYSPSTEPTFCVIRTALNSTAVIKSFSTTIGHQALLTLGKSSNATIGTFGVTADTEVLGSIAFDGVNSSSAAALAAYIKVIQNGAAGATFVPADMLFYTGTNAAGAAERMRITTAGRVGIGVTDPSVALVINGYAKTFYAGGESGFAIDRVNGTRAAPTTLVATNIIGNVGFAGQYDSTVGHLQTGAYISAVAMGTWASLTNAPTDLIFYTASTTEAPTERLRLTSTGKIGIGCTAPASVFEIRDGLTTVGSVLTLGTKETAVILDHILGKIIFYAPLEASGTDAILPGAYIAARAEATFSSTVNQTSLDFATGASESATTKMCLRSTGNLGLGILVPSGFGSDITTMDIRGATGGGLRFGITSGIDSACYAIAAGMYIGTISDNDVLFTSKNIERMRITNAGIVGINSTGTTARLGQKLAVAGSAASGGAVLSTWSTTAAEGTILDLSRSKSATIGTQTVVASGDAIGQINFRASDGDEFCDAAIIASFVDGAPGNNDMPGNLVFYTTPDAAKVATEKMRITSDGRVAFQGLHNNANAVTGTAYQWLASGTYTPTLVNTTNIAASTAYACQWMRVGNVVTVSGRVNIDITTANVDTLLNMDLPIASTLGINSAVAGTAISIEDGTSLAITGLNASDNVLFQRVSGWANTGNLSFMFTFTYLVV